MHNNIFQIFVTEKKKIIQNLGMRHHVIKDEVTRQ